MNQFRMTTQPSLIIPSTLKFRLPSVRCVPCPFCRCSETYLPRQIIYTRTSPSVSDHNNPIEKLNKQPVILVEEHRKGPVEELSWRKVLLDVQSFVQEVLKWYIFIGCGVNFVFCVRFRFYLYPDVATPVGLFVGWHLGHFLKELSLKMFNRYEENDLKWRRLGLCFLFMSLKIIPKQVESGKWDFLLHVANGGLMLLLWCWDNYLQYAKKQTKNDNIPV